MSFRYKIDIWIQFQPDYLENNVAFPNNISLERLMKVVDFCHIYKMWLIDSLQLNI